MEWWTQLSNEDFNALQNNNLPGMSDAGYALLLKAQDAAKTPQERAAQRTAAEKEKLDAELIGGMSSTERLAAAAGKAVSIPIEAAKQAFGNTTRADVDEARKLDAPLMGTTEGKVGFGLGAFGTAAPLLLAPGGASALGSALYGAAYGAATPVGDKESVFTNALLGAGAGAVGPFASNTLAKVISPAIPAGVRALTDAGVRLSPGQRLGGSWHRAEDALTSFPAVGGAIRETQQTAIKQFNTALENRALSPLGIKVPQGVEGYKALAFTEDAIGNVYNKALAKLQFVKGDEAFASEISALRTTVANSTMPVDVQRQFNKTLRSRIGGKFQGQNTMTAETFKEAESELGRLATKYQGDASADKQLLGDALEEVQASLRRLAERNGGPEVSASLKAANASWAQFKRIQRAMVGAEDEIFSPERYIASVKMLDKSKDKGKSARGEALGQDLGNIGMKYLGTSLPESGTPYRTTMASPVSGGINALLGSPLAAIYTKPVLNALHTVLNKERPRPLVQIGQELNMLAPTLGRIGIGANSISQGQ